MLQCSKKFVHIDKNCRLQQKSNNFIVKMWNEKQWWGNNNKKKLTWNLFYLLVEWLQKWYCVSLSEQMIADYRTNDEKCFCFSCKSIRCEKKERWNANKTAKLVDFPVIWLIRNCLITGKVSFIKKICSWTALDEERIKKVRIGEA